MEPETKVCWACDKEALIEDMVFTADRYICNTKECLLNAFENLAEQIDFVQGILEACR